MLARFKIALVFGLAGALITCGAAAAQTASSALPNAAPDRQIDTLQDRILHQPELADDVAALQSDDEVQKLLEDPEIAAALQSGNTAALLANPKVSELANHPKIQEITKKLGQ